LRVPESKEILDNTDIHPEQYALAKVILEKGINSSQFDIYKQELSLLYTDVNSMTIDFILESYSKIGHDPRVLSTHKKATKKVNVDEIKE